MPHAICHLKPRLPRCRLSRLPGSDMWACLVLASFEASLLHVFPSSALHLSGACQKRFPALLQQSSICPHAIHPLPPTPGIMFAETLLALPSLHANIKTLMRSADQLTSLMSLRNLCSAPLNETLQEPYILFATCDMRRKARCCRVAQPSEIKDQNSCAAMLERL